MELQSIIDELGKLNTIDLLATGCMVAMKLIHNKYKEGLKYIEELERTIKETKSRIEELERRFNFRDKE